jgi:hypothetical protein
MTAILLDLPVEALHAEAWMDPGDIADLAEFIDGFQADIPRDELSDIYFTDGLTTLNHLRKGEIDIRPSNSWIPISLLVFLNNLSGKWHVQMEPASMLGQGITFVIPSNGRDFAGDSDLC